MAYGLRVYNDSGILQIDDEVPNYAVAQRGTVYIPGRSGSDAPSGVTVPYYAGYPNGTMVFVRPPYGARVCGQNTFATYESFKGDARIYNFETYGVNVDYAIFAPRYDMPDVNGYGLKLYNSAGRLVYCSSDAPGRIVGAMEFPVDGVTRSFGNAGGPGALYVSLAGTGWYNSSQVGGGKGDPTGFWNISCLCASIDNESVITLSPAFFRGPPGGANIAGVRSVLGARL